MGILTKSFQDTNEDIWNQAISMGYPTGMTVVDILTANFERDENLNYTLLNGGLQSRANTILGESSTGKSSMGIGWCANCVDYVNSIWPNTSEMIVFDIEKYFTYERIKQLTGWNDNDIRNKLILYHDEKTDIVSIFNEIKKICDLKEQNRSKLWIKTPLVNINGVSHYEFAPTFVIIDSIAMLTRVPEFEHKKSGELYEVADMGSNTEAMRDAMENTKFIKKVKPLLTKYNIVLLMINHKTSDVSIGRFDIPKRYLPWLKPGEKIVGGKELIYQSSAVVEIMVGEKLSDDKLKYGKDVYGSINKLIFRKNKNGFEGIAYPIVMSSNKGYMCELSDFELITNEKYGVTGLGSYTFDIMPELGSIKKSNCYEKCQENPLIARVIQFTAKTYLIYTSIYRKNPINLNNLASDFSLEERMAMVINHTISYPKYRHLDELLLKDIESKIKRYKNYKFEKNISGFFGDQTLRFLELFKRGYILDTNKKITIDNSKIIKGKDGKEYITLKK